MTHPEFEELAFQGQPIRVQEASQLCLDFPG